MSSLSISQESNHDFIRHDKWINALCHRYDEQKDRIKTLIMLIGNVLYENEETALQSNMLMKIWEYTHHSLSAFFMINEINKNSFALFVGIPQGEFLQERVRFELNSVKELIKQIYSEDHSVLDNHALKFFYKDIMPQLNQTFIQNNRVRRICYCRKCVQSNLLSDGRTVTENANENTPTTEIDESDGEDSSEGENSSEVEIAIENIDTGDVILSTVFRFTTGDEEGGDENDDEDMMSISDIIQDDDGNYEDVPITIPTSVYYENTQLVKTVSECKDMSCPICLEPIVASDSASSSSWTDLIVKTECSHYYHHTCLQKLCCDIGPPKCPVCRHDVRDTFVKEEIV